MRTATEDYQLRGKTIKTGRGAAAALHLRQSRRGGVRRPVQFRVDRENNRHVAFGYGAHVCLGQHLAKMEITRVLQGTARPAQTIELTGEPKRVQSTFVIGTEDAAGALH